MNYNTSTFFNVSKPRKDQGQICIMKIPKPKSSENPDRRLLDNMRISAEAIRHVRKRSRLSVKIRDRLHDRLDERITHMDATLDEIRTHQCMELEKFLNNNLDIRCNFHKIWGLREALEREEVRRNLAKIKSIFVGSFEYNWNLDTFCSIHGSVPINSEFRNAALAHIASKSHRRSAFDLQRARGKRCPIIIIIIYSRFNPPPIFSMNGFPFLKLYSYTYTFYSTIGGFYYGCYYGIANYSYSQSQFCSNSSSSSSVVSIHPKFFFREYRIRCIPEPKGKAKTISKKRGGRY